MEKLEEFFKLKERGTSVRIEVVAGITTFMTMAYVLVMCIRDRYGSCATSASV